MKSIFFICLLALFANAIELTPWSGKINQLSDEEKQVLIYKGTEPPFSGKYTNTTQEGIYTCKLCGTSLYNSNDKFKSHCGWPSFDDAIKGAVKRIPDADGRRVEIVCAKCGGHLGHVFEGEGYTKKDTRYCVNSLSLNFHPKAEHNIKKYEKAYFSGGCFWGVEYYLEKLKGVQAVHSGFMGGKVKNPTYNQVVNTDTGHLETVEVLYDSSLISYEQLVKAFFEIHDPTQTNGQGPDIGEQYLSAVFVSNGSEKKKVKELIVQLKANGFKVATKVFDAQQFYKAEEYHQDYYRKKGSKPYCHTPVKRF